MFKRVLLLLLVSIAALSARAQPNIVVVFTDDVPYHILSATGHPYSQTPNIDRLANEGALFRKAFVATPLCSPSRASYLTGTHPQMHGITGNNIADNGALKVFAADLQAAGYRTGLVGKWHMGNSNAVRPGFSWWAAWADQGTYNNPSINLNGATSTYPGYTADVVTDLALDFINSTPTTTPFFLWVSHKNVHDPRTPAPRHANLYPEAVGNVSDLELKNIRCLRSVDDSVGTILNALNTRGILNQTIVIFTSDSGFSRGFPHPVNGGDKRGAYDEMTRVPMLMRYPPAIAGGTLIDQLVSSIDLAPTFLTYAGVPVPARMHGRALQPLFSATPPTSWRDTLYMSYFRDGQYPEWGPWRAVRTKDWKYVKYLAPVQKGPPDTAIGTTPELLFDLNADPREKTNVIGNPANAAIAAQLRAETERLYLETSIPRGWFQQDVGAVGAKGETVATLSRNPSTWTLKGSGAGIKGTTDEFHFVHRDLSGNGTVKARLNTLSSSPAGAAAGVMIRGLNSGNLATARFASLTYVNGQGAVFSYRTAPGAAVSTAVLSTSLPRWLRVQRVGNLFTGAISNDGTTWTPVGSVSLDIPAETLAGLATTSNVDGTLATATFANVGVTVP